MEIKPIRTEADYQAALSDLIAYLGSKERVGILNRRAAFPGHDQAICMLARGCPGRPADGKISPKMGLKMLNGRYEYKRKVPWREIVVPGEIKSSINGVFLSGGLFREMGNH